MVRLLLPSQRTRTRAKRKAHEEGNNFMAIIFHNEAQKSRFELLSKCKIVPTRYNDEHVMEPLGIKDDIVWMFNKVSWDEFISIRCPTYIRITLEFLSLVDAEILTC